MQPRSPLVTATLIRTIGAFIRERGGQLGGYRFVIVARLRLLDDDVHVPNMY